MATAFQYVKRDGDATLHYAYKERGNRPWPGPSALCNAFVDRIVPTIDPDGRQQICPKCDTERGTVIAREAGEHVNALLAEALDPTCICGEPRSAHLEGLSTGACVRPDCTCVHFQDRDDVAA